MASYNSKLLVYQRVSVKKMPCWSCWKASMRKASITPWYPQVDRYPQWTWHSWHLRAIYICIIIYIYICIYMYIYICIIIYIHHMFSSINPYIFSQNKTTMITMYSTYSTTVPPFWNHPWSPWMLPTINIWRCWLYPSNVPISFNIHWITLSGWWLSHPSEKYESQLGWWHSQYMEK